jgi:O-antigen ligase
MFVLGGGSQAGPASHLLAQLAGIALLAVALIATDRAQLWHGDRGAAVLLLGLAALFVAQLVPLPAGLWPGLPGRALFAQGDVLMFGAPRSRPLSLDSGETLSAGVFLAPALAIWLLARRDRAFAERVILVYLAFLGTSLVLALAQLVAGPGQLRLYPTSQASLPTGFFANRNHQSIAMVCGIPLAAALHCRHRETGGVLASPWLATASALACMIGALLTGSRTGAALLLPGLASGLAIALAGRHRSAGFLPKMPPFVLPCLALAAIGALGLAVAVIKPGGALGLVFSRSFVADDPRYAFWPVVSGMIGDTLPWGIGFGNFRYAFDVAATPAVLRVLYINHAHNDWLEYTLEAGLPGLALAFAFLVWLVLRCRQALRAGSPLAIAAGTVILLLLAHSIFDYPLRTISLSAVFACCAALLSPAASPATDTVRRNAHTGRIATAGVVMLVLAGISANDAARYVAVRSGQGQLATALPAPGSRLLAVHALQLAEAHAPFGAVADAAVRAVALSPLAEPAFTAAAIASPDPAQASELLDHAWRLSRRDPALLLARMRLAQSTAQPQMALDAIDALYRLHLATPLLIHTFSFDLGKPAFLAETVRRLSADAPWRSAFLTDLATDPAARPAVIRLAGQVQRSARPLTRGELQPAIAALAFGPAADPVTAFRLWQLLAPGAEPLAWQPVAGSPGLPFDWTLADNARITEAPGRRLEFTGEASPASALATKQLPLAAGRYRVAIAAGHPGATLSVNCGQFTGRLADGDQFVLPAGCPSGAIAVYASGADGWIGVVRLVAAP